MSHSKTASPIPAPLEIIILAAGKGTRMHSDTPKVLHAIAGKSMLQHVIDSAARLDAARIHVVIGYEGQKIRACFGDNANLSWVNQEQQLGTGARGGTGVARDRGRQHHSGALR